MDQDTYDKKMELVSETYEFAKTNIWQQEVDSMPCDFADQKEWHTRFRALQECVETLRNIAAVSLKESLQPNPQINKF